MDLTVVRFLVAATTGWLHHEQKAVVSYLVEENRTLRDQLRGQRLLLTDDQRRQLAVRGRWLGSLVHESCGLRGQIGIRASFCAVATTLKG